MGQRGLKSEILTVPSFGGSSSIYATGHSFWTLSTNLLCRTCKEKRTVEQRVGRIIVHFSFFGKAGLSSAYDSLPIEDLSEPPNESAWLYFPPNVTI